MQRLFGDTGRNVIGTRHGEKLYETLMTREERLRSEDLVSHYSGRIFLSPSCFPPFCCNVADAKVHVMIPKRIHGEHYCAVIPPDGGDAAGCGAGAWRYEFLPFCDWCEAPAHPDFPYGSWKPMRTPFPPAASQSAGGRNRLPACHIPPPAGSPR